MSFGNITIPNLSWKNNAILKQSLSILSAKGKISHTICRKLLYSFLYMHLFKHREFVMEVYKWKGVIF